MSFSDLLWLFEEPDMLGTMGLNFLQIAAGHIGRFRDWIRTRQLPMLVAGDCNAWNAKLNHLPYINGIDYAVHMFSDPGEKYASARDNSAIHQHWGAELRACLGCNRAD